MFSLIIAIVSIALIVALVAATMYHGGDTLTQGRAKADAAAIVAGAQQVSGAAVMHLSLEGTRAANIGALVTAKYLASIPTTGNLTLATDTTDPLNTKYLVDGTTASDDVCVAINKAAGDADGAVTAIGTLPFACINGAAGTGGVFHFKY